MQAKRVAATGGILTIGVAAAAIAAAGFIVYVVGYAATEVICVGPRAISRAKKRRRERRVQERRRQQFAADGCACYFQRGSMECMFCGGPRPSAECEHYFPLATVGDGMPPCLFCHATATAEQYTAQHPGAPIPQATVVPQLQHLRGLIDLRVGSVSTLSSSSTALESGDSTPSSETGSTASVDDVGRETSRPVRGHGVRRTRSMGDLETAPRLPRIDGADYSSLRAMIASHRVY